MKDTSEKTTSIETYLRKQSETRSMELFFDFLTGLTNVDAVREAFIIKVEELIRSYEQDVL